jgi:hypothetical protein
MDIFCDLFFSLEPPELVRWYGQVGRVGTAAGLAAATAVAVLKIARIRRYGVFHRTAQTGSPDLPSSHR